MRTITHPGPIADTRADLVPCHADPIEVTLRAGHTLTRAITQGLAEAGYPNGYLRLDGLSLAPLHYVTPAPATGDGHAAWYSQTFSQPLAKIQHGGAHLGLRDGQAFVHCHALWQDQGMGHVLCDDSLIADDVTVQGWGLRGAGLVAQPDRETRFTLFRPQAEGAPVDGVSLLVTLRPNQDIGRTLTRIAQNHHISWARVEGIGSLVGTVFEQAPHLASYATELLIIEGVLQSGEIDLQVASVGFDGAGQTGRLQSGQNAICVTAEVLLIALPDRG
jgi:predicted DNA-binding protein with PD1-like motif